MILWLLLFFVYFPHYFYSLIIEDPANKHSFVLGEFQLVNSRNIKNDILTLFKLCLNNEDYFNTYLYFLSSWNRSLTNAALSSIKSSTYFHYSHVLNSCSSNGTSNDEKIMLLTASLGIWPWNGYAAKNLAYLYEWHGRTEAAYDLFFQSYALSRDPGCGFHSVFVSPPLLWDVDQARIVHFRILQRAAVFIRDLNFKPLDPMLAIRELQLNIQYLGLSPGLIQETYSMLLRLLFPELERSYLDPQSSARTHTRPLPTQITLPLPQLGRVRQTIRLGVVSEHESNSSPGLCLLAIMERIGKDHTEDGPRIEIIYFARPDSITVFAEVLSEVAVTVVTVTYEDMEATRRSIAQQRVDVLLFLALPTEKFTYLLAHARLAPVQMQYGIGHPLSSGIPAVDYTIVSERMVLSLGALTRSVSVNASYCISAVSCGLRGDLAACPRTESPPPECGIAGHTAPSYTEQTVLLDSLGYFLNDPRTLYGLPPYDLEMDQRYPERDCAHISSQLSRWGVAGQASPEMFGCFDTIEDLWRPRTRHVYACLQIPKKMHPLFDSAMAGILRADDKAVILVVERAKDILPRWVRTINMTEAELVTRFVFVPRLAHGDYLTLLSWSAVFLNPFPFGAGITSSEALALCIPVVSLFESISVLQFALGQLRMLGEDVLTQLSARTASEYVDIAVGAARGQEQLALRRLICERRPKLFGESVILDASRELKELFIRVHRSTSV